jgi:NADP-dependent 3-hydroxy acid dehydrogenase YdfG
VSSESLRGKTAVVTGASSGIGRAIAEKFGRAGAHVYLAGRTAETMEAWKGRIESDGGEAPIVVVDLRDSDRVRSLVAAAVARTARHDGEPRGTSLSGVHRQW